MIRIQVIKGCQCDSHYTPSTDTVSIGLKSCGNKKGHCFARNLPATLAHEIGHALLKHGKIISPFSRIEKEALAWAYARARGKVSKTMIRDCLTTYGHYFNTSPRLVFSLLGLTRSARRVKLSSKFGSRKGKHG